MIKELEDILYDSSGLTAEQKAINDAEWRKAENWSGWLCPSYSSAVDSRPVAPSRLLRPRPDGSRSWWDGFGGKGTVNRAHPRGRVWFYIGWTTVIIVIVLSVVAMILSLSEG